MLAVLGLLPGLYFRFAAIPLPPLTEMAVSGAAMLSAGFLLSWGVEAAEEHISRGLALAVLALITVLPEYVIDLYYAFQAGRDPSSNYVQYAAANMTGANRLLVGLGWPAIALLYWWRSGKRAVELNRGNAVEVSFLAIGSIYSFVIVLKGQIDWTDFVILFALFGGYLWRLGKMPRGNDDDDDDDEGEEVGPAAALSTLPRSQQFKIIGGLAIAAGAVILLEAEPFAQALIGGAGALGVSEFLLIQWLGPLASETPEIIIMVLFTLSLRPGYALGALISDKINQWTLLVGSLPIIYSLGAGRLLALPLDGRQKEEFFLTAAQSLFAVALLLKLRFGLRSAGILLGLFLGQFVIAVVLQHDEARLITTLTAFAWFYMAAAAGLFFINRRVLVDLARFGVRAPAKISDSASPSD
ncbi:sodium:proton exchanger [Sphingomonas sp.]|uniref:sodium:proton exchanger n=1 Tax=Sphingomonas sp. TaxID=28214 RepID=UPI0025DDBF3E|nr:sodium:proton exchanger [Sphingomonas sp.]